MKDLELIQKLRAQVIDDSLGCIRCKPWEKAKEYFRLSVKVGKCLEHEAMLYHEVMSPIWTLDDDAEYAKWASLFDLLEEGVQENSIAPLSETLLKRRCEWALKTWNAEGLHPPLGLLLLKKDIWGGQLPDPQTVLRDLASRARRLLEMNPPAVDEAGRVLACVSAMWDMQRTVCQEKNGSAAVPEAVLNWLKSGGEEGALDRAFFSMVMLVDAPEAAAFIDRAATFFSGRILQKKVGGKSPEHTLQEARTLLGALGGHDRYRELYGEAVEGLPGPFGERHQLLMTNAHPDPKTFKRYLAWVWETGESGLRPPAVEGADDPKWRQLIVDLCRAENDETRMAHVRDWIMDRFKGLMVSEPHQAKSFLDQHKANLPAGFPDPVEMRKLIQTMQGLAGFNEMHLKALAGMVPNPEAQNCVLRWGRLFEELGDTLPVLDRNEWLRIGLDLLNASLAWDAAVMMQTTLKVKNQSRLMIMGNPGCAQASQQIMACENDLFNDLLIKAALNSFPTVDDQTVAQLKSSGLGINLGQPDFERMKNAPG